jgi:hypothetical protein
MPSLGVLSGGGGGVVGAKFILKESEYQFLHINQVFNKYEKEIQHINFFK